jgi:hypothetical protein
MNSTQVSKLLQESRSTKYDLWFACEHPTGLLALVPQEYRRLGLKLLIWDKLNSHERRQLRKYQRQNSILRLLLDWKTSTDAHNSRCTGQLPQGSIHANDAHHRPDKYQQSVLAMQDLTEYY